MPRQPRIAPLSRHTGLIGLVLTACTAGLCAGCADGTAAALTLPTGARTSVQTTPVPSTTTTTSTTTTKATPRKTTRTATPSTKRSTSAKPAPRTTTAKKVVKPAPKPKPKPRAASPTPATGADLAMAAEVLRLVNVERKKAGCSAVHGNSALERAARGHSQDMAKNNYFSHTSLDGRSPWDRIRAQGYAYGSGENIAAGQRTAAAVMDAWMHSSGHRANILKCSNKALGVGIGHGGKYGIYWTQDFGRV